MSSIIWVLTQKNVFFLNFTPNLLLFFAFFKLFSTKNAENDYFHQGNAGRNIQQTPHLNTVTREGHVVSLLGSCGMIWKSKLRFWGLHPLPVKLVKAVTLFRVDPATTVILKSAISRIWWGHLGWGWNSTTIINGSSFFIFWLPSPITYTGFGSHPSTIFSYFLPFFANVPWSEIRLNSCALFCSLCKITCKRVWHEFGTSYEHLSQRYSISVFLCPFNYVEMPCNYACI